MILGSWSPQGLIDYYQSTMVISRESETILVFGGIFKHIQWSFKLFQDGMSEFEAHSCPLNNQYAITMPFKSVLSAFKDYIINWSTVKGSI